jgi:hypothetical protein
VLVAAADAKLEVVADPLSPALVNVTDFEEPWSFSERMFLRRTTSFSMARSLGEGGEEREREIPDAVPPHLGGMCLQVSRRYGLNGWRSYFSLAVRF